MSNPVPGSQVQLFRQNGLGNQIWHLQEARESPLGTFTLLYSNLYPFLADL